MAERRRLFLKHLHIVIAYTTASAIITKDSGEAKKMFESGVLETRDGRIKLLFWDGKFVGSATHSGLPD